MKNTLALILFVLPMICFGQEQTINEELTIEENRKYEVTLMLGLSSYEGDLHCFEDEELGMFTNSKFAFGLGVKRNINKNLGVGLSYRNTKLNGSDNKFTEASGHTERGFEFTNSIHEITARVDYAPFGKKSWKVQPYIYAGMGFTVGGGADTDFNMGDVDNPNVSALVNQDMTELKKSSFALPIGLGIKGDLTDKITIGLEGGLRFLTNDYIDGVSLSGNADVNDFYGMGGVVIGYKF